MAPWWLQAWPRRYWASGRAGSCGHDGLEHRAGLLERTEALGIRPSDLCRVPIASSVSASSTRSETSPGSALARPRRIPRALM